jgi:hypothetical protein
VARYFAAYRLVNGWGVCIEISCSRFPIQGIYLCCHNETLYAHKVKGLGAVKIIFLCLWVMEGGEEGEIENAG